MKLGKYSSFFGEQGVTSASANHLCNIAKETLRPLQDQNLRFVNTQVEILVIGNNDATKKVYQTQSGTKSLKKFKEDIEMIGNVHGLVAWLREGIKAKKKLTDEIDSLTEQDWAKEVGKPIPLMPSFREVNENDYYNQLPIYERAKYLATEAKCAAIGKAIHPTGKFSIAREEMLDAMNEPVKITDHGTSNYIETRRFSIAPEEVDNTMFDLQNKHRELQKILNKMNCEMEDWIRDKNSEIRRKTVEAIRAWEAEYKEWSDEYKEWKSNEKSQIRDLKICIPDQFKNAFDFLNNL